MLVISRKSGESLKVADDIEIIVVAVDGQRVRLGIKAPKHVKILRSELGTDSAKPATSPATQEHSQSH